MIDPPNSGSTSSKGGYTKSKGGNHSTSEGGDYIKQHHLTQCHPTNAVNPPVPHLQQQPVPHPCQLDDDDDAVMASNCSPHAPLPSLNDLPLNPHVHPALHHDESQPALPPSIVQPNIPPPKVLANPSFIPATTPTVPYNNVHDLQLNPLRMLFQQTAITKQQTYSLPINEPNDKRIKTAPTRPSNLLRCSTWLISNHTPCNILRQALYHIINLGITNSPAISIPCTLAHNHYTGPIIEIEEFCNGVVHPVTKETITHYRKLIKDPLLKDLWTKAMSKEILCLVQGCTGITKCTTTIFSLLQADPTLEL